MEYNCSVWSPFKKIDGTRLENVQQRPAGTLVNISTQTAGAPNFRKTGGGGNLFQPGADETSKFRGIFTYRAANVSKFGVHFCAKLYKNEDVNIHEMYHKSMHDP